MGVQAQEQRATEVGAPAADDDGRDAGSSSLVLLPALAAGLLSALAGWVDHDVDGL